jgi:hypothetical protein
MEVLSSRNRRKKEGGYDRRKLAGPRTILVYVVRIKFTGSILAPPPGQLGMKVVFSFLNEILNNKWKKN